MKTGQETGELARLAAAMADGDATEQDVRRLSALLDGDCPTAVDRVFPHTAIGPARPPHVRTRADNWRAQAKSP